METIKLHSVVPQVFARRTNWKTDVWDIDVLFEKGRVYDGPAVGGAAKSTFCSYVLGYRHDYNGKITFGGADIAGFKVKDWVDIRRRHIAHLFQELRLFPELTSFENVEIKNRITRMKSRSEITEWFDMLGIADKIDEKIARMSFGQQQRVAMIRALVQPFDFLLADEPISHLDDANSKAMGELMMVEATRQGAGVIVTSIGKHMELNYDKILKL